MSLILDLNFQRVCFHQAHFANTHGTWYMVHYNNIIIFKAHFHLDEMFQLLENM